nr:hypothetical protein [Tanacetum cinerariifolium]
PVSLVTPITGTPVVVARVVVVAAVVVTTASSMTVIIMTVVPMTTLLSGRLMPITTLLPLVWSLSAIIIPLMEDLIVASNIGNLSYIRKRNTHEVVKGRLAKTPLEVLCLLLRSTNSYSVEPSKSEETLQKLRTSLSIRLANRVILPLQTFLLSSREKLGVGDDVSIRNSDSNQRTQRTSLTVEAIALYSASAEDRDTMDCFLLFQKIGVPPSKRKYPVRERLMAFSWICHKLAQDVNRVGDVRSCSLEVEKTSDQMTVLAGIHGGLMFIFGQF